MAISAVLRKFVRRRDGNAAMLLALALPALIGGGGLAVDVAQWYLWKRDLQFAVDQAATAGAWARADAASMNAFQARARQEYDANLGVTKDFAVTPTIQLVDYDGGNDNAVEVTATATRNLPFTGIFLDDPATVRVTARAVLEEGGDWSGCIIALDPSSQGAFTLGGNASGNVACGVVALSDDENAAMVKNGNSSAQLGQLVAAGNIDVDFEDNGVMHPYTSGLENPFADVEEPDPSPSPSRTYSCPTASTGSTVTTGDKLTTTTVSYVYVTGNNSNQAINNAQAGTNSYAFSPATAGSVTPESQTGVAVPNGTVNGTVYGSPGYAYVRQVKSSPKVHEVRKTVVDITYSNVSSVTSGGSDGIARPLPGTYSTINIACTTEFQPGIYLVDEIDFGQNQVVTGENVLFVIRNSGGMHINSKSNITLSGISKSMLMDTYGYSEAVASKLARMVIYDAESTDQLKINGNADVHFWGTIYMPNREVWFNGTATASGNCMMLVANRVTFTGTVDLDNFCLPSGATLPKAGGAKDKVKLVT